MLYPQKGDRIVAVDYVTSLHPIYSKTETEACCSWSRGHAVQSPDFNISANQFYSTAESTQGSQYCCCLVLLYSNSFNFCIPAFGSPFISISACAFEMRKSIRLIRTWTYLIATFHTQTLCLYNELFVSYSPRLSCLFNPVKLYSTNQPDSSQITLRLYLYLYVDSQLFTVHHSLTPLLFY